MKKIILTLVLATLCLFFKANSQSQTINIKPLNIGDTIPEAIWNKPLQVVNHPQGKKIITLNDYKGKLIVLDFMNTYCGSCIEALPEFESLVKKNGDKILILIVLNETGDRVKKFIKTNPVAKGINLPFIYCDTTLQELFPHRYVSHEAWIHEGNVKAITSAQYVTAENINTILQHKPISWGEKADQTLFNYNVPILVNNPAITGNLRMSAKTYYSSMTEHMSGVGSRKTLTIDSVKKIKRIDYINYSVLDTYLSSVNEAEGLTLSHVLLNTRYPENLTYKKSTLYRDEWNKLYNFCYEAVFPLDESPERISDKIRSDLNYYHSLKGEIIIQETQCYKIIKKARFGNSPHVSFDVANQPIKSTLKDLLVRLNESLIGTPLFTDLDPMTTIDVKINKDQLKNFDSLNEAFKISSFTLEPVLKETKMFMISDSDPKSSIQP